MQKAFRVVLIVPAGYKHSLCFTEVAFLLKSSLVSCGQTCDIAINDFSHDRINIVLGFHLMQFHEDLLQYAYIPYQLEQLSAKEGVFSENIKSILSNAFAVWDYSLDNIVFLKQHGIVAIHVPLGYHERLEQIHHKENKDIDVLFFGSMGERRKQIISALESIKEINVKTLFGIYGKERDEYISRSKVVLNIHYYSSQIFEAVRISYLINNKCCVISEESVDYPYSNIHLPIVPYDKLIEKCIEIIGNTGEFKNIGDNNYREFKEQYPMLKMIENVL